MSSNNVYVLGNHKLTREPIYVASDNHLLTTFYTNSFDSPAAVCINGWYNEERPYQESELQELDIQEVLKSPYISDYTRGLLSVSSFDTFVAHTARATLVSEMNMARFIPVDMVEFKPGTKAYESINFKPIKREGSLVHVRFPETSIEHPNMVFKDVTSFKILKSVSGAYSLDNDIITIDLDKLRAFFSEFATEIGDLQDKLHSAMVNLVRGRASNTHLRYQERAKFDMEISNAFRVIRHDGMDDLAKLVKLLDALDDNTSVVDLYYVTLEINRMQSSLDSRCIECGLKHMIRAMGNELVSVITQVSTPITTHFECRGIVSVSDSALIEGVATVDAFVKGIIDACVVETTPQEARDVLDASAKLLAKLLAICQFVRYDILTLAGYQYIIKT